MTQLNNIFSLLQGSMCCGYGPDGLGTGGFDCVVIPGAQKMTPPCTLLQANAFCGRSQGLVTVSPGVPRTVCCEFKRAQTILNSKCCF